MKTLINFLLIAALWMWASVGVMGQNCQFTLMASDEEICQGENLTLSAQILGSSDMGCNIDDFVYEWSIPNSVDTSDISVSNVATTTTYTVTITDNNGIGIDTTISRQVIVTPRLDITIDPLGPFCRNDNMEYPLTASVMPTPPQAPPNMQPEFSGEGVSNDEFRPDSPSIVGNEATVTYTVYNGVCGNESESIDVIVNDTTAIDFVNPGPFCLNDSDTVLTASPPGGTFTGGGVSNGRFFPTIGVGDWDITYNYTNMQNCSSTETIDITVNSLPQVVITSKEDSICTGGDITIDLSGDNVVTSVWQTPDGMTLSQPSLLIDDVTLNDQGPYTVLVTDANGCQNTAEKTFKFFAPPTINIDGNGSACSGDPVTIWVEHSPGPGDAVYSWSRNDGSAVGWQLIPTMTDSIITDIVSSQTEYRVDIEFVDETGDRIPGCGPYRQEGHDVLVVPTPIPTITPVGISCLGGSTIYFNATPRQNSEHEWDISNTTGIETEQRGDFFLVNWPETQPPNISIILTEKVGSGGCNGSDAYPVSFTDGAAPTPAEIFFSPINNTLIYNDATVNCYQWGYLDTVANVSIELEGEIYQSYVAGDIYEQNPERNYWCRVGSNTCEGDTCSTTVLFRFAQDEGGTPEEEAPEKFVLYPNPNDGSFRLAANRLLENSPYELRITNVLSQVVRQETVTTTGDELDIQIDINNAAGVYYMSLYREGKLKKVIPFVVLQR